MIGAIAGDIIGSVHEWAGTKTKTFRLFHPECAFTDDTVLTVAVADCLVNGRDYVSAFHDYFGVPHQGHLGKHLWILTVVAVAIVLGVAVWIYRRRQNGVVAEAKPRA